jgi:hypothetical protein
VPWWPLAFSLAFHLLLLMLPLHRGAVRGPDDRPQAVARLNPLSIAFREPAPITPSGVALAPANRDMPPVELVPSPRVGAQLPLPAPAAGNAIASDRPGYLPPERLTQLPEIRDLGNLELPGVLRPGDSGRLVLEVLINDEGRADAVRVIETSVPAPFLANAIRVFQWARYDPGRELSHPVRSRIQVEIVLGQVPTASHPATTRQGGATRTPERIIVAPR